MLVHKKIHANTSARKQNGTDRRPLFACWRADDLSLEPKRAARAAAERDQLDNFLMDYINGASKPPIADAMMPQAQRHRSALL